MTMRITDGKLEIQGPDGTWTPVPDGAVSKMVAIVNGGSAPAASPAASPVASDELARFQAKTLLHPADWLDKLRTGKIETRDKTTEFLYHAACRLTGQAPNPFDFI